MSERIWSQGDLEYGKQHQQGSDQLNLLPAVFSHNQGNLENVAHFTLVNSLCKDLVNFSFLNQVSRITG